VAPLREGQKAPLRAAVKVAVPEREAAQGMAAETRTAMTAQTAGRTTRPTPAATVELVDAVQGRLEALMAEALRPEDARG